MQFKKVISSLRPVFLALLAVLSGASSLSAHAQVQFVPTLTTIIGGGTGSCTNAIDAYGDGCTGTNALVATGGSVRQIAVDAQGDLFFTDSAHNLVREWNAATGIVTVVAGGGGGCGSQTDVNGDGCPGPVSLLNNARGLALDSAGNIYIADGGNNVVRVVSASTGIISVFAGGGTVCSTKLDAVGDGCLAIQSTLSAPNAVATDLSGNLYISDYEGGKTTIREVSASTGIISIVAGKYNSSCSSAGACGDGGLATAATLNQAYGVAVDQWGNIFIADDKDFRIRMVNASTGIISTIAGVVGDVSTNKSSGDGGPATSAHTTALYHLTVDAGENVYFADGKQVRELVATTAGPNPVYGNVVLAAGTDSGNTNLADGQPATNTGLGSVYGVAVDHFGNVYVNDAGDNLIRRASFSPNFAGAAVGTSATAQTALASLTATDTVNTIAAASASNEFAAAAPTNCTLGSAISSGTACDIPVVFTPAYPGLRTNPLIAMDASNTSFITGLSGVGQAPAIAFTPGTLSTFAGTGAAGYAGDGGAASAAKLTSPGGVVYDGQGNAFFASTGDHSVRRIDATTGVITTVAGTGSAGYSGDNGAASAATLKSPKAVAVDPSGNLYIADTGNNVVREVLASTGKIVTIAGTGTAGYSGDNSAATSATLRAPAGVAVDVSGDVFIADTGNNVVRQVYPSGLIATIAGSTAGTAGNSGSGGLSMAAKLNAPTGIVWTPTASLLIANAGSGVVDQVSLFSMVLTTVAGSGSSGFSGDGGVATSAQLNAPSAVAQDAAGNIYIADTGNARIRRVDAATGIVNTVAGGGSGTSANGSATANALAAPTGIALDANSNLLIADSTANVLRRVDVSHGAALAFGNQGTFAASSAQTLTVTNTGNLPLALAGVAVIGNFAQASTGSSDCTASTTLVAGQSCSIGVTFTPTGAGALTGSVVVTDNALSVAGATQMTTLNGNGVLAANQLVISGVSSNSVAGTPQSVTVAAYSNTLAATNYTGTVRFSSSDTAANLPSSYTFTAADNGTHTFAGVSFNTVGTQTLTVADTANSVISGTATTSVDPGLPGTINVVSGSGQYAKFSTAYSLPMVVLVHDANGNPVSSATVTFTAPTTGASVNFAGGSTIATVMTDANGTAISPAFSANATTGAFTVTATVPGVGAPAVFTLNNLQSQATTSTSLALLPTGSAAAYGQVLTLTAVETPSSQSGSSAGGTMTFYDGAAPIAIVPLSNGTATTSLTLTALGGHSYKVVYSGDPNFSGSASPVSTVTVSQATTTLKASAVSVNYGVSTTALVTVTGQNAGAGVALPTGTATYTLGTAAPTVVALVNGVATIAVPNTLATGSYPLAVQYNGDSNYLAGGSVTTTVTVNKLTTVTMLSSSGASVNLGATVTFTATVAPGVTTTAVPTGSVTFYDGSSALTTTPLANGTASYNTTSLVGGSHNVTAVYSGDGNFSTSSSAPLSQTINPPALAMAASPASITVVGNQTGSTTLIMTPTGGYKGSVQLSCSGLPLGSACVFNIPSNVISTTAANSVNVSGNNSAVQVGLTIGTLGSNGTISQLHRSGFARDEEIVAAGLLPTFALLACWPSRKRRLIRRLLMMVIGFAIAGTVLSGCGNGITSNGGRPAASGTYNVVVNAVGGPSNQTSTAAISVSISGNN